jgi:hypothetical protein
MIRFAEVFPDEKIVNALGTQLGWTLFRYIIAMDDPLKRDFCAEKMSRIERWSTCTYHKARAKYSLCGEMALSKSISLSKDVP